MSRMVAAEERAHDVMAEVSGYNYRHLEVARPSNGTSSALESPKSGPEAASRKRPDSNCDSKPKPAL